MWAVIGKRVADSSTVLLTTQLTGEDADQLFLLDVTLRRPTLDHIFLSLTRQPRNQSISV